MPPAAETSGSDDLFALGVESDERARRTLELAAGALTRAGHHVNTVLVPAVGLPELDASDAETWKAFRHTPEALLEAWRVARHVEALTAAGSTVVVADGGGLAGLLALGELASPPGRRRAVWTVAGDSLVLRWLAVAGTIEGVRDQAAIDWEVVQYRNSERVLALSDFAVRSLGGLGVEAERLDIAEPGHDATRSAGGPPTVWVPEPVSRQAQTAVILRGLADVADRIVVSAEDEKDGVWTGTTWEAIGPTRAPLGDRLTRAGGIDGVPDWMVLGDMTAVPAPAIRAAREAGAAVAVPEGSMAAALWPDASTWRDADDLVAIMSGSPPHPVTIDTAASPVETRATPGRAVRVSVGIPVFRTVEFLDETVASVLGQSQAPHEVLIIDDGSQSKAVTEALARWEREPLVRSLVQPNRGVCVARNTMVEAMTGDSFLLVDADDVLAPEFIERTAAVLRTNEALLAVATWTRFFGEYDGIEAKPPFDARIGLRENPIISTGALVDMAVRDLGIRFADDLAFLYCEDWHLWSQIVAAGGEIGLVPEPLIRHRTHLASGAYQRTPLAAAIGTARATEPLRTTSRSSLR